MDQLTHPVVGVRVWYLFPRHRNKHLDYAYPAADDIPGLYSVTSWSNWHPGVNHARCAPPFKIPHARPRDACEISPSALCECGLYAYHDLAEAAANYNVYFTGAFGVVRGWGRIQAHFNGWRAQYAEVLALVGQQPNASGSTVQFWRPDVIQTLAKEFRVPVVPFSAFPAMLSEFGQQVPFAKRPNPLV